MSGHHKSFMKSFPIADLRRLVGCGARLSEQRALGARGAKGGFLLLLTVCWQIPLCCGGAVILGWDFEGVNSSNTATVSTTNADGFTNAGLMSSVLSASNLTGANQTNFWRRAGFGNSNTALADMAFTDYVEFTISPLAGQSFSLDATNSIMWKGREDRAYNDIVVLRSSLDSFGSNVATFTYPSTGTGTMTVSMGVGSAFQNLSSPVTFRIYATDPTGTTGEQTFGHGTAVTGTSYWFLVNGSVVPEPSKAALLLLFSICACMRRTRR